MELTNEFTVAAPVEQAWATLLDVERIAPCMPGAELTSFEGDAFTGTVKVKLGPVNLTYAGKGRFVSKDEQAHRIVIEASGKDKRGTATAAATITGNLFPEGDSTRVRVVTDLRITGAPAQFGRGMIADVAGRLVGQFASCLAEEIAASTPSAATASASSGAASAASDSVSSAAADASGDVSGDASTNSSATAEAAAPAPPAAVSRDAQPIDLLAVTGTSAAMRRTVPYVVTFLAGAAVGAVIVRLLT